MLDAQWASGKFLCVGIDPRTEYISDQFIRPSAIDTVYAFVRAITYDTLEVAGCYKFNFAAFSRLGSSGLRLLEGALGAIQSHAPETPIILDGKFGDIKTTNEDYATWAFNQLGVHAVTVNPYVGIEDLSPFFKYPNRGVFILCRTSNESAVRGVQGLIAVRKDPRDKPEGISPGAWLEDIVEGTMPLYMHVARQAAALECRATIGLVVGATVPEEIIAGIRSIAPNLPFLMPGIGHQGGSLEMAIKSGSTAAGGVLLSASRSLYSSLGAAARLHQEIKEIRSRLATSR